MGDGKLSRSYDKQNKVKTPVLKIMKKKVLQIQEMCVNMYSSSRTEIDLREFIIWTELQATGVNICEASVKKC